MTHIQKRLPELLCALMVTCAVIGMASLSRAQEEQDAGLTSDSLTKAQAELRDAWQEAARSHQQTEQLESALREYDERVRTAINNVELLRERKYLVRQQIRRAEANIDALNVQLKLLAGESKEREDAVEEERVAVSSFIRTVAAKSAVDASTGPVAGGVVSRRMLGESLGDVVEEDLYRTSLIRARSDVFTRLVGREQESRKAMNELQHVAFNLTLEIVVLERLGQELNHQAEQTTAAAEEEIRTRDLTEAQLQQIKNDTSEAESRVSQAQRALVNVGTKLKDHLEEKWAVQEKEASLAVTSLSTQERVLSERRDGFLKAKEASRSAYERMQESRNGDRKQYKRVEETEQELKAMGARVEALNIEIATALPDDADRDDHIRRRQQEAEVPSLTRRIPIVTEKLSLLREGYQEDFIDDYLSRRAKAQDADRELPSVQASYDQVSKDLIAKRELLESIKKERATFNVNFDLVDTGFLWPAYGKVTAGYNDGAYQKFFGVPHRGIDIAVKQGTPVYATAAGVVLAVKDGGRFGYTYVLLGHRNGYTSLYGHLSNVYVSLGAIVDQGQVVGLSGGRPGTPGSGLMTTGPHLHFEIHKNGVYENPFQILTSNPVAE